jgi:hypothetical protein
LDKSSFILNFESKALKIKFKNVPARRSVRLPKNLFDRQAFGHAGVPRVRYSRKIPKKERKPDADRDGKKN